MNKAQELLGKYAGQIAMVILFIIILYLKSLFVTIEKYEGDTENHELVVKEMVLEISGLKDRVTTLEHKVNENTNDINTVSERLDKKIKIVNEQADEIDKLENNQIGMLKDIEYLKRGCK